MLEIKGKCVSQTPADEWNRDMYQQRATAPEAGSAVSFCSISACRAGRWWGRVLGGGSSPLSSANHTLQKAVLQWSPFPLKLQLPKHH